MNDKQNASNPPDEPEGRDFPVGTGQDVDNGMAEQSPKSIVIPSNADPVLNEQASAGMGEQPPEDDPLADVRRALVEEDIAKREKKKKGLVQRVARLIKPGRKSATRETEAQETEPNTIEEVEDAAILPQAEGNVPVVEADESSRPDAESGDVAEEVPDVHVTEEFIPAIETVELIPEESQDDLLPKTEESLAVENLRSSEVLRVKREQESDGEDFEAIRKVALEDYDSSSVQSEGAPVLSWRQKFRMVYRGLKPLDKFLIFGAIFLMLSGGLVGLGLVAINALVPEGTPVPTEELPFPVGLTLPGGWEFQLTKGRLENDLWLPGGPEWLEGTELCRWVALPWSLQLEAVVRTLKSNDPIELTMSNADQLKYRVQSIQKVPVDQIDSLAGKNICLLLILVDKDSDTRWVVTAIP